MIQEKQKKMLLSYARALVATMLTIYASGVHDPTAFLAAVIAAVIPPAIRALDPQDHSFGVGSK